jgi:hypothetical protein
MGNKSRRKGMRIERAIADRLQLAGIAAVKVSRTGYRGPDLSVPLLGIDRTVEVKARCNGFRELYGWLQNADILIVHADRHEPLVVLPIGLAGEIAARANGARP